MIDIAPATPGPSSPDVAPVRVRLTERHVLALGLAASGGYVLAAVLAVARAALGGTQTWAALHLALAGAAVTAIATFIPHFAVTMAGTRAAAAAQRLAAVAVIAAGAALAIAGIEWLGGGWAAAGSLAVISSLGVTAWHAIAPLRDPLARRHPIVTTAYLVALAELAVGVALGGLAAAGVEPVLSAWATLRPAHAWLTLFGAVSLTIFATLVYLAPTVVGARVRATPWVGIAAAGMLVGPPLAALGFATDLATMALAGAAVTGIAGVAQAGYVADVLARRGPFTSEHDWRRVAVWHLAAGTGWFAVATLVVVADLLTGRALSGWSIGLVAIPLVAGWMLQELVGSWTHLAPSVTPGSAARNAAQRRALSPGSRVRPLAWNLGVAAAWLGLALGAPLLAAAGAITLGAAVVASVATLARALTVGRY